VKIRGNFRIQAFSRIAYAVETEAGGSRSLSFKEWLPLKNISAIGDRRMKNAISEI